MAEVEESPRKYKESRDKKDKKRKSAGPITPSPSVSSAKKHKKRRREESEEVETSSVTFPAPNAFNSITSSPSTESAFHLLTTSLYVPLSPLYAYTPHHSLESENLDPLILTYYPPLRGVILAYKNLKFKQSAARVANDSPFAYTWVTVDFLVYTPKRGMVLEGWINLMSESHIGLLVLNTFNASIPREKIPDTWKWVEDRGDFRSQYSKQHKSGRVEEATNGAVGNDVNDIMNDDAGSGVDADCEMVDEMEDGDNGGWMDSEGNYIDGLLKFKVDSFKASGHIMSIGGSLLDLPEPSKISPQTQTPVAEMLPHRQPKPSGSLPSDNAALAKAAHEADSPKKKDKKDKKEKKEKKRQSKEQYGMARLEV